MAGAGYQTVERDDMQAVDVAHRSMFWAVSPGTAYVLAVATRSPETMTAVPAVSGW